LFKAKSRSDDTLLTEDFNLRKLNDVHAPQSPARTTQWIDKVSSLQDLAETWHAAYSMGLSQKNADDTDDTDSRRYDFFWYV